MIITFFAGLIWIESSRKDRPKTPLDKGYQIAIKRTILSLTLLFLLILYFSDGITYTIVELELPANKRI